MQVHGVGPGEVTSRAELAAALTRLRESAGFSIRDLARRVGAPSGTLGDYLSGRHVPSAAAMPTIRRALVECGVTDPDELESWLEAIRRVRSSTDRRVARAQAPPPPYRGLAPFEPEDAALFFGRSAETRTVLDLLRRLRTDPGPSRGALFVIGPSGAGKSSVLRAGVVAAIRAGALGEAQPRRCVVITPGTRPSAAFTAAQRSLAGGSNPAPPGGVIVLDQFEEVFTLADQAERSALISALDARDPAMSVVLGMRADFYAAAAREAALLPALQHAQILVGAMGQPDLRAVILEPARKVGAHVDEALADVVLAELVPRGSGAHAAGVLPLLSHALLATWQLAGRNRLTVSDFRTAGGIDGAVQRSAEAVYTQLDDAERELARRAFLRMVTIDDIAVTRRRVTRDELAQLEDDPGQLRTVIDRFVAGRLLTADEATVEISHEALLTAWPRLRDWVGADRDGLRIHRRLTDAADAWLAADHDELLVLRGGRLEVTGEWAAAHRTELTRLERSFLEASVRRAEMDSRAELQRTRRRRQLVAVFAVLALVASGFAVYGLRAQATAMRLARAAAAARDEALSRQVAIEAVRLRRTEPALAAQLALAAYRLAPTREARSAVIDSQALPGAARILGPTGPTASVAVDPSGGLLATSAADGNVHLWALHPGGAATPAGVLRPAGPSGTLFAVAFSPDGSVLAASGSSRVVQLWDLTDAARPRPLPAPLTGPTNSVYGLAFDAHGDQLAAASADGSVYRWDLRDLGAPTALPPLTGLGGAAYNAAYSPGGGRLVAGSDTSVSVWDVTGVRPRRIDSFASPDRTPVRSVAVSPAGDVVAAGTENGAVVEYRLDGNASGQPVAKLSGFASWVNSIAFSPDGATLAAGSSDDTARVWSTATGALVRTIANSDAVTSVAYAGAATLVLQLNDGRTMLDPLRAPGLTGPQDTVTELGYAADGSLLLAGAGGTGEHAAMWNTGDGSARLLTGALAAPPSLTASGAALPSPDGRLVALGTTQGPVVLWDVTTPQAPHLLARLPGSPSSVSTVGFSPDSHLLAAGYVDHSIRLWDVADPQHPQQLPTVLHTTNYVNNLGFSPDGRLLAAGGAGKNVYLWDVADPRHITRVAGLTGFSSYLYSVTFSPDGHLLAAGGGDKAVRIFDVTDPRHPRLVGRLMGPTDSVYNVAFDPRDQHVVAASSKDGTTWLWRIERAGADQLRSTALATLTAAGPDPVYGLAFSPDGHTVAAAGVDPAVRLWNIDIGADARAICADTGSAITRAEWREYVPGAAYRPPCR